jgi:hypothetical protein
LERFCRPAQSVSEKKLRKREADVFRLDASSYSYIESDGRISDCRNKAQEVREERTLDFLLEESRQGVCLGGVDVKIKEHYLELCRNGDNAKRKSGEGECDARGEAASGLGRAKNKESAALHTFYAPRLICASSPEHLRHSSYLSLASYQ